MDLAATVPPYMVIGIFGGDKLWTKPTLKNHLEFGNQNILFKKKLGNTEAIID